MTVNGNSAPYFTSSITLPASVNQGSSLTQTLPVCTDDDSGDVGLVTATLIDTSTGAASDVVTLSGDCKSRFYLSVDGLASPIKVSYPMELKLYDALFASTTYTFTVNINEGPIFASSLEPTYICNVGHTETFIFPILSDPDGLASSTITNTNTGTTPKPVLQFQE